MKKKIRYKKAPKDIADAISSSNKIEDFLPKPEELVLKEENIRITMNLTKRSVDFFKKKAIETGVPYQKMIKSLIDIYVKKHHKIS